ncbi:LAMI_0G12068g1_1 [Lachancea mirantina]|uniref:LAMI_0G12068g1_1 n=1 Tax=Lachancea mirantina TaxID=1230905 RepID=A0A1G4KBG7_9SACH|nr:LAMI_0G12068g1_1 [Lachancea mirantina]
MPPRTTSQADGGSASPTNRSRPMVIPRQGRSFDTDFSTSVTEETISSSQSSNSLINPEESSVAEGEGHGGHGVGHGGHSSGYGSVPNLVGTSWSQGKQGRSRPGLNRTNSSYTTTDSFMGNNGSYISMSFVGSPTHDDEGESEPEGDTLEESSTDNGAEDTVGPDAGSDRDSASKTSVPMAVAQAMVRPQLSQYFEPSRPQNEAWQDHTPYHNTPTSVSSSYRKNAFMTPAKEMPAQSTEQDPVAEQELVDLAEFSTDKLLEMLTALLNKIVKSNDQLHWQRPNEEESGHGRYDSEVLSFRGKHVPAITLQQYFQRIQKYCPTTNDVFLSLLVYFDRIAKACNQGKSQVFVMDSYNIHRLIISAVTVSTKFFSDFFYSNSRYARVGGISLQELNFLELQFLVLCDFELIVPVDEMRKYGKLLRDFWQRENGDGSGSPKPAANSVV